MGTHCEDRGAGVKSDLICHGIRFKILAWMMGQCRLIKNLILLQSSQDVDHGCGLHHMNLFGKSNADHLIRAG